jgi:hypothetical protein
MVENASSVAQDKQVRVAVVVIVPNGHTHAEQALGPDARLLRHIGEGAVSVVSVKSATQGLSRFEPLRGRAVYQIKVEQAVLVVIDPPAARAHGLDQILLATHGVCVAESDARISGDIHKLDRAA